MAVKYLGTIILGLCLPIGLILYWAPDEGSQFLRFLWQLGGELGYTLVNRVTAAESQVSSTDSSAKDALEENKVFAGIPVAPDLKRLAWPPRFEDQTLSDATPSGQEQSAENSPPFPADSKTIAAPQRDAPPGLPPSLVQPPERELPSYPATSRPVVSWEPSQIRPVFDPMEAQVVRLPDVAGPSSPQVSHTTAAASGFPVFASGGANIRDAGESSLPSPKPVMSQDALPQFAEDSRAQPVNFVAPAEVTVSDQEASHGDGSSLSEWARTAASLQTDRVGDFRQEICEQTRVLARVGSEVILAGEILGAVNEILLPYQDKVPVVVYEQYKQQLMRQLLKKRIEMKLVYEDIKRKIPRENLQRIEQEIAKFFEEKEVPARLRKMGLQSAKEWDERLRSVGSSLEHEKRAFIEGTLARDWIKQQLASASSTAKTISPEVLWEYYQTHLSEFEQPAEVRWQQLMVKKRPDRSDAEAYAKLAELGNRVLQGEPFEEVARSGSEGPTASEGGVREPVQPGSLRSRVLEEALFSLPVGQLSPILEDEQGFHIVRVLERREASRIPFTEAQVQIRERLAEEEKQKQLNEYLAKLRQEIPVWNIYEAPTQNSSLLPATVQGDTVR